MGHTPNLSRDRQSLVLRHTVHLAHLSRGATPRFGLKLSQLTMATKLDRVSVDAKALRSALKARKGTPQMVLALSGRTEIGSGAFNTWLRQGSVPVDVADVLSKFFDIHL